MIVVNFIVWWHTWQLQKEITAACKECNGRGEIPCYGNHHPEYDICKCYYTANHYLKMNREMFETESFRINPQHDKNCFIKA